MQLDYFETRFKIEPPVDRLPDQFAILTAYQTTGEQWTLERNQEATMRLEDELQKLGVLLGPVIGYSPRTGHAEPGFVALLSFEQACNLGQRYQQDAVYFIRSGMLFVSHCDHRRAFNPVTQFLERVDVAD